MKIAIIDKIGLCYDGNTLNTKGLGGSESAVISISRELTKIGFSVTVFNNCNDSTFSKAGIYDGVRYIDNSDSASHFESYDIVISSRSIFPFTGRDYPFIHSSNCKKILWLHDTFIEGDHAVEQLLVTGVIDYIFTLSDWHTSYILNSSHGLKRNFEVLKKKVFQTRNGVNIYTPEVDIYKKDKNHFVYNASATKGMIPLVEDVWPVIKSKIPDAKLTIIGGYYRFRENALPDAQELTVSELTKRQDLTALDVTFTGVITQKEISEILSNAWMMLYPGAFPETSGISTLESLVYNTPLVTTRFGALEETAIEEACYLIDYAIEPNSLFPQINKKSQVSLFVEQTLKAYSNDYLHQQKQQYCEVIKDIVEWSTIALQWKQFLYSITDRFLSVEEYRKVTRINKKVSRVFNRVTSSSILKEFYTSNNSKRIVVISPFWNAESYITNNILSVAQQDYDNYIHILIDDASSDNSYEIAASTISKLDKKLQSKFRLFRNSENLGGLANQFFGLSHCLSSDIVMLLDGDDWLVNNNTIFNYYSDLYNQGYEFTYGSMKSLADSIPLIAQEYPNSVKDNKSYRKHLFSWHIPYTHLRTCLARYFFTLNTDKFKVNNKWMKAGHDNPLFYELIEQIDPSKIYCNKEIVCMYNDLNPLNDFKINNKEQTANMLLSYLVGR